MNHLTPRLRLVAIFLLSAHHFTGCAGPVSPSARPNDRSTSEARAWSTPSGVAYKGVTAAMWSEINAQRASFGDSNDCQSRVSSIPASGGLTLQPGADINAALSASSVVFLSGGTYKISKTISLDAGKKLIGVAGQTVTIDASAVDQALHIRDSAVLANVQIRDAGNIGVSFYNAINDTGSSNALVYQVSVGRTGLSSAASNTNGTAFGVWQGASYNCIVSTEAFDGWNEIGYNGVTANGGDADGYRNTYGAHHNSFIDSHSYRNGDDGFDMWEGGVAFMYFNASHDNGKTTGKTITGDGNGIKLGVGSVSHKLYKFNAYNNKANGFDLNGNTVQPTLVQCTATSNGANNFAGISI